MVLARIRKFGGYMSNMVMPNLGAFVGWGIIAALFIPTGWIPNEQFNELYEFVKRTRFDKMGVFEYSREKNTTSYSMQDQIPAKIKRQRRKKLMTLQQKISKQINEEFIGKTLKCLVEGFTDDGLVILRAQHDAPEIDGMVYASSEKPVIPGDFENVLIENSDEYDLFGRLV